MSDTWDRYSTQREYFISVELYVSSAAGSGLRKPAVIRKKPEKRDSSGLLDDSRLKDRSSWQALPKGLNSAGHWRTAKCKLSEEGDRCFLNIYVDEALLYQTVYVHLLNQTDIRAADPSLFFRKDCISLYCIEGQRWTSATSAEPIYLQFPNPDTCSTWLALLKSYAIPEIYGRWFFPVDGGSYRMWRQIDMSVVQARHIRAQKAENGYDMGDAGGDAEFDGELSCEIHLNDILCGRTTAKKRGEILLEWQEKFTFSDLPPFETLDINIWKEKKSTKPTTLGIVQIQLHNFRRGETTEGWFPIMQGVGGAARETQIGELRLILRVDEEIILPSTIYRSLAHTFKSRNFLDWVTELETKLKLKNISNQLIPVAIANDCLIDHIQEFARREVMGTQISPQTLFRGNTVLTKVIELAMTWYGKPFLEASIGHVLRKLCAEKIAIEVDPSKSGKSTRDVEKNVDQLVVWCQEFWTQIYSVRGECPEELKRLFHTIRKLVEERWKPDGTSTDLLPRQSVSAFIFLRFIVPAILHPHLFGLCPGLPPEPVQRSLTLIAKVIQRLANFNSSVQKEPFMDGIKDWLTSNVEAMTDYIAVVSTPIDRRHYGDSRTRNARLRIMNDIRDRSGSMAILDREAIPKLPLLLDVPRHLAIITSAVIRSCRDPAIQPTLANHKNTQLDEFCSRCAEVEDQALLRVTQLAAKLSARRPSLPVANSPDFGLPPTLPSPPPRGQLHQKPTSHPQQAKSSRPSTAPSSGPNTPRQGWNEMPSPTRPIAPKASGSSTDSQARRPQHVKVPSSDSIPTVYHTSSPGMLPPTPSKTQSSEPFEDLAKKKRGLFRGILKR